MDRARLTVLSFALAASMLGACSSEEKPAEPGAQPQAEPLRVERSVEATISATVKWVDHATRRITLTDKAGHEETFVVDQSVRRLAEVQPGDNVVLKYRASLIGELREPTAEERENPIVAVAGAGRAPASSDPAAGVGAAVRVVTTVQAIDVPNMRVVLQGPMGNTVVVKAQKKENVERLKINDTIVITYSEGVALSLEKAAK